VAYSHTNMILLITLLVMRCGDGRAGRIIFEEEVMKELIVEKSDQEHTRTVQDEEYTRTKQDAEYARTTKDEEQGITTKVEELLASFSSSYCLHGGDWCEDPADYPEDTIKKAVDKQKTALKIMFDEQKDILSPETEVNETSGNDTSILLRSFDLEYENICDVNTQYIKPRAAKNKKGMFMFIVNHPEGVDEYIQLVRVVTCSAVGEACGQGRLASSVDTECHQEYLDHKLVALSATGEELVVDTFSFPSCCTCLIKTGYEL